MQRLRTVTSLDVSAVAGHHAMPAALLFILGLICGNKVHESNDEMCLKHMLHPNFMISTFMLRKPSVEINLSSKKQTSMYT